MRGKVLWGILNGVEIIWETEDEGTRRETKEPKSTHRDPVITTTNEVRMLPRESPESKDFR